MKNQTVCIVSKNPIFYDERVKKEADTLADLGYRVYIICKKDINISNPEKKTPYYEKREKYYVIRVVDRGEFDFNIRCFFVVRKIDPEILWCIDGNTMFCGVLAKNFLSDIYTIVDFHEILYERDTILNKPVKRWFERICEKIFSKSFDEYLSVSPLSSKVLKKQLSLKKDPVNILNCPYKSKNSYNKNDIREKYNIPLDRKIIIYEGIIFPGRGLEFLLDVLISLPEYHLYLVGPDRYHGRFEKMVSELKLESRVHKFGLLSHDDMMQFITVGDIGYIGTEKGCINHEFTLSNKLYEYTMSGLPVIASDVSAYRFFVDGKDIGKTFNLSDKESFIQALIYIERNSEKLNKNILDFTEKNNWERQIEKIKTIIKRVIKNKKIKEITFKEEESDFILKDVIIVRSAPFYCLKNLFANNKIKRSIVLSQPGVINEVSLLFPETEIISFPKDGFFKLFDKNNIELAKKIKNTKIKDVIITSSEDDVSDKWRLFLFFRFLGLDVYKYTNSENLTNVKWKEFIPFKLIRVIIKE
ncbi:MAG: hypothetical protein C0601_02785 [Candidatus Muiribacterium halophilum]|uniref:Glycosyl transferase family 1 domain-containing protein n=1 Tax=Muiribacterium halophilum TaxID=2053465 RepID=A0A2N5ZKE2_MUIH1|nr:MAG: hypothetical protein C0601_02785 [Candidatus Muirbacterium halophilum]